MTTGPDRAEPARRRGGPRLLRWINVALAAVLCLFALAQYNDPDLLLWVVIYGLAAAWSATAAFRPRIIVRNRTMLAGWVASLVAFLAYGLYLAPTITAEWIDVETARESIGLFICAGTTLVAGATSALYRRRYQTSGAL